MPKVTKRQVAGLGIGTGLVVALILLWASLGLEQLSWLATAIGLLITCVGVVIAWITYRAAGTAPATSLDEVADLFAREIERVWTEEASARGLNDPQPVRLVWSVTKRAVIDHLTVIGRERDKWDHRETRAFDLDGQIENVADSFLKIPSGKLVVLGKAGSGKTSLVILLSLALLRRRRKGEPIPVIFSVASWNSSKYALHSWMESEIVNTYDVSLSGGRDWRHHVVQSLIQHRRILPIFDGFDELPKKLQVTTILAVNHYLPVGYSYVLTSRPGEFQEAVTQAGKVLRAAAVVEIEPVLPSDVIDFLQTTMPPNGQIGKLVPILGRLHDEPYGPLATALSTPLMISLARAIYLDPGSEPDVLLQATTQSQVEDHLLDELVPSAYRRPAPAAVRGNRIWKQKDVQRWLGYIARRFHSDRMAGLSPTRLYTLLPRWLLLALPALLISGAGWAWSGVSAAAGSLLAAVIGAVRGEPPPSTALQTAVGASVIGALMGGMSPSILVAVPFGILAGVVVRKVAEWANSLTRGVVGGIAGSWVIDWLSRSAGVGSPNLAGLGGIVVGCLVGYSVGSAARYGHMRASAFLAGVSLSLLTILSNKVPFYWVVIIALVVLAGLGVGAVGGAGPKAEIALIVVVSAPLGYTISSSMVGVVLTAVTAAMLSAATTQTIVGFDVEDIDGEIRATRTFESGATIGYCLLLATGPGAQWSVVLIGVLGAVACAGAILPVYLLFREEMWSYFARCVLAAQGRLPMRLDDFLSEARARGVLRREGVTYQFRHNRLRVRLALAPQVTGRSAGRGRIRPSVLPHLLGRFGLLRRSVRR